MPKPMRVKDQILLTDRILQQLKAEKEKELDEMKSSPEMVHINNLMKDYEKLNDKYDALNTALHAQRKLIELTKAEWNDKASNEYIKFDTRYYDTNPYHDAKLQYHYGKLREQILFEISFKTLGSDFNAQELCNEIAQQFSNKKKLKSVA